MNFVERVHSFSRAFPKSRASWPHIVIEQGREVLYATWVIGQNYRNPSKYYGAFPRGFIGRVMALFPDIAEENAKLCGGRFYDTPTPWPLLHAFSGSLQVGEYVRLDCNAANTPDVCGDVYDVERLFAARSKFRLIIADPPYTAADAERYGTKMIDRRRTMQSLATIAEPGAHLVWLDTVWPMHSKKQWVTVGRIALIRSTQHRVRLVSIFRRVA